MLKQYGMLGALSASVMGATVVAQLQQKERQNAHRKAILRAAIEDLMRGKPEGTPLPTEQEVLEYVAKMYEDMLRSKPEEPMTGAEVSEAIEAARPVRMTARQRKDAERAKQRDAVIRDRRPAGNTCKSTSLAKMLNNKGRR